MAALTEKNLLPDIFGAPQTERKTVDALRRHDPGKAKEQLEKSKEFAIKMMLAGVKNTDPFEEGSDKSSEMLTTSNLIAQLDSISVQVNKMTEMAEAVKNPGFNALDLQGKEVSYDNSERYFDGSSRIVFDYDLEHNEENAKNLNITTTINIKNAKGEIIYSARGAHEKGAQKFIWDGRDKNGKYMPAGTYVMEVESKGTKLVSGQFVSFPVRANSALSGIVESVEIENGAAARLHLQGGKIIDKQQVRAIKDAPKPSENMDLSYELVGKTVELDLSKIEVKGGKFDLYFHNDIDSFKDAKITVFDKNQKIVANLTHQGMVEKGFGVMSFDKVTIADGRYSAKISFDDYSGDGKSKFIENKYNTVIIGIDRSNNSYITIEKNQIKPHHILSAILQYQEPLQVRAASYVGQEVSYKDNKFTFRDAIPFTPQITLQKPEENREIDHVIMRIFDEQNQVVAVLSSKPETIEAAEGEEGGIIVKFSWDGAMLDKKTAKDGSVFTSDFTTMLKDTQTSQIYASTTQFNISNGRVSSSDIINGEIQLNLDGGITLQESDLLAV